MTRLCLPALLLASCLSTDTALSTGEGDESGDETTSGDPTTTSTTTTTTTDPLPSTCNGDPLRVAAFNIEGVGPTVSDQFAALQATLVRIDADVVCMQEVGVDESANLRVLAENIGYDYVIEADDSPAIGGEIKNACLGRVPVTFVESYGGNELSPGANDVGRDILAVRAEPAAGCFVGLFAVHLKSGIEYIDLFRRQVEVERLVQAVAAYRQNRPADGLVILGDFNEQVDDPDIGTVIDSVPAGLPSSYQTGSDIQFPLTYEPFTRLAELGFVRVEATWEDLDLTLTWNESERLDYVMYGQAQEAGSEVYNSCEDNGIDDDPPGNYLEKAGDPLQCFVSADASDHLPVVVDLVL